MEAKFYVEKTLGKLAKWLRILGFDTIYEQDIGLVDMTGSSIKDRILLSRKEANPDGTLFQNNIFIASDHPAEQLTKVISKLNLTRSDIDPFSRCIRCNVLIETVDKISIKGKVPDYVWETQTTFQKCGKCDRIYWPGSHANRAMDFIQTLFSGMNGV